MFNFIFIVIFTVLLQSIRGNDAIFNELFTKIDYSTCITHYHKNGAIGCRTSTSGVRGKVFHLLSNVIQVF